MDTPMLGGMPSWDPVSSSYADMPFPHVQVIPTYSSSSSPTGGGLANVFVHRGIGGDAVGDAGSGATTKINIGGTDYNLYRRRSDGYVDELHVYLPLYV